MRTSAFDFSPLFRTAVGFDRLTRALDSASRASDSDLGYPPYNIEKLDAADYPFDDFWPEFQKLEGHWSGDDLYSVMVDFGYLGIVYNTDKISAKEASSYKVMWDPKVKGKLGQDRKSVV